MAADNLGGPHTVTLSTGTYTLTNALPNRQITIGNTSQNIAINGNGPANTVISMLSDTNRDRIMLINPAGTVTGVTTKCSGIKFVNGYLTSDTFGGGGIYAGGIGVNILDITNCWFDNNVCPSVGGNGGIGGAINMFQGTLNVVDSTFTSNKSLDGDAGAIFFILYNLNSNDYGLVNITRSTFIGNSAKQNGGAIEFSAQGSLKTGQTFSVSISKNTFIANTATNGGAIAANNSAGISIPMINYNRFSGNTSTFSAATSGLLFVNSTGSVNATLNWWGCNTGPTNAGACDRASGIGASGGGILTVSPWLQLRHVASPNLIYVPNATTLTASFLTNSAGTTVSLTNLTALIGLPITFNNAVRGTLSGAQATIQASGTATATFTANAAGAGSADATVDDGTATASITIPTGVSSINRVNIPTNNFSSVQWLVTFTNAISSISAANFALVNGGLGGSPLITSVVPAGPATNTNWTVTANTGSGFGTLGLNMTNSAGASAIVTNVPFTGQVYTIDLVPPNTSITAQPASVTNSTSASFSFTGSDTGVGVASFQSQLDGGAYLNSTSPVVFLGLSETAHTFNVRAVDGVGNTDATPATVTWTVDITPPTIGISTPSTPTAHFGEFAIFTVTYADLHFNSSTLSVGDVTLNRTGSATGTVVVGAGSGTTRVVTVTNVFGSGTIAISIAAATASDTAGNSAPAAGPSATFDVVQDDFGDAPATYPTLLVSNAARHTIPVGGAALFLGAVPPDGETNGQPNAAATGDNIVGSNDEDGVVLPPVFTRSTGSNVTFTASASGILNGWIDWNADGDWSDAGEQVFVNRNLVSGANVLSVVAPTNTITGSSAARFRFGSQSGLAVIGQAIDGEVEDYIANFAVTAASTNAEQRKILAFQFATNGFVVTFAGIAGQTGFVQAAATPLGSWTNVSPPIVMGGPAVTNYLEVTNPVTTSRVYRALFTY